MVGQFTTPTANTGSASLLGPQEPAHAGKYRPQPANHGDPDRHQIKRRSQSLTELFHCKLRKASASDKRSRSRRNSRYRSVMLTALGFFKAFFCFFDFGRTSTLVRLCAFMGSPPSTAKNKFKQTMCQSNPGDATRILDQPLSGAFLLKFNNACVTRLGHVAEKIRRPVTN